MNARMIDPAADDALLYDLDLLAGHRPEAQVLPRLAPYRVQPTAWVERRCPVCRGRYGRHVDVCPRDGQPLDEVRVSCPFLWLG